MPLYTADALILRTYALGESDRIVVFLTRDRGKKRGVAKNARRSRRRFGGALEPLTYGRVGYFERERRELVSLNFVEPARSPLSAVDGDALGYVGYFAELIDEWAPEADANLFEMHDADLAKLGIEQLPQSLSDSLRVMEGSQLVQDALGEHIFEWFLRNKRREWQGYKSQVTPFEIDRYLRAL